MEFYNVRMVLKFPRGNIGELGIEKMCVQETARRQKSFSLTWLEDFTYQSHKDVDLVLEGFVVLNLTLLHSFDGDFHA